MLESDSWRLVYPSDNASTPIKNRKIRQQVGSYGDGEGVGERVGERGATVAWWQ